MSAMLNRANERWVAAADFLSLQVIVEQLRLTGDLVDSMWSAADLDALGKACGGLA